jgi:hypothetical protein
MPGTPSATVLTVRSLSVSRACLLAGFNSPQPPFLLKLTSFTPSRSLCAPHRTRSRCRVQRKARAKAPAYFVAVRASARVDNHGERRRQRTDYLRFLAHRPAQRGKRVPRLHSAHRRQPCSIYCFGGVSRIPELCLPRRRFRPRPRFANVHARSSRWLQITRATNPAVSDPLYCVSLSGIGSTKKCRLLRDI